MDVSFRCDCPFTSAIDILGDKWILVIVKQMLIDGKETFKDFIESGEAIATNILSTKLKLLEEWGFITKSKLPHNKKTNLYHLTEKALTLTPILAELALWSDGQLREIHPTIQEGEGLQLLRTDKAAFIDLIVANYRKKLAEISDQVSE